MSSLRIGIFGGTFDPIHAGHLIAAKAALNQLSLDKLYFVPTASSLGKVHSASAAQRAQMVELAIHGEPKFALSMADINRKSPTFTIDTLHDFASKFPRAKLFFLLGADAFANIENWKDSAALFDVATFVVITRPGYESPLKTSASSCINLKIEAIDLSSSEIRELLASHQNVESKIPEQIKTYIETHGLYSRPE